MASSEVDQKFLGRLAKTVERDNPFLAQILFRILGLSLNLAEQLVAAKKRRSPELAGPGSGSGSGLHRFLDLIYHILWLSREGLNMLEQYVLPWARTSRNPELIVLAWKLRASFLHIYVLFYNQPSVSPMSISSPEGASGGFAGSRPNKGKGVAADDDNDLGPDSPSSSPPPTRHRFEGGPVGPPPGLGPRDGGDYGYGALGDLEDLGTVGGGGGVGGDVGRGPGYGSSDSSDGGDGDFVRPKLITEGNYLPLAHEYFQDASRMADELLWGSHSLRLSVKTEYAAFLYECVHDTDASRKLARDTIAEVYEAQEGMDDDMFDDACELVAVLGRMKKRGLAPGRPDLVVSTGRAEAAPGMENPI